MATITEDYVNFETAKLLKEKGFDEPIQYFYKFDSKELYRGTVFTNTQIGDKFYNAPTLQMAMKWLREVHNRFIEVLTDKGHDFKSIVFRPAIYDKDLYCLWESDNYKSYEQATEAAINYCLKHLI